MLLKKEQYIFSVAKNTVVYYLVNHGQWAHILIQVSQKQFHSIFFLEVSFKD